MILSNWEYGFNLVGVRKCKIAIHNALVKLGQYKHVLHFVRIIPLLQNFEWNDIWVLGIPVRST